MKLKFSNASDAGNFECQVSTNPKISQVFKLTVVGKYFGSDDLIIFQNKPPPPKKEVKFINCRLSTIMNIVHIVIFVSYLLKSESKRFRRNLMSRLVVHPSITDLKLVKLVS